MIYIIYILCILHYMHCKYSIYMCTINTSYIYIVNLKMLILKNKNKMNLKIYSKTNLMPNFSLIILIANIEILTLQWKPNKTANFLSQILLWDVRMPNILSTSVYWKPTFSGLGLRYFSYTPFIYKINSIKTLISRA